MLNLILHNLDKYPLDGVVHFELEIDYPFIHNVIDYMESECKKFGIPFMRLKPTHTWEELYERYGFPMRAVRWCNEGYKLTAKRKLEELAKQKGYYVIYYIGYCANEQPRVEKRKNCVTEIYPLVEENINEDEILAWARNQEIFNDYYKLNKRCGCMFCPMASRKTYAYLCKYYPEQFEKMIAYMRATEIMREKQLGRPCSVISSNPKYNADYLDSIVRTKWLPLLEDELSKLDETPKNV